MAHLHFVDYPSMKKVLLFFLFKQKKSFKKGVMDVGRSFDFFFNPFFNIMYCVCVCVRVRKREIVCNS